VAGMPTSLAEVLKFSDRNEPIRLLARRPGGAGEWGRAFHGEGLGVVDLKDDLLYYFQQVDRGLHDFLRTEHVPLVLASVAHLWPIYRQANTYPHLIEQGIPGNPDQLTEVALANYIANTDPDGIDHGLEHHPMMAFTLCYVAAHLALDLVDEENAEAILTYCEDHL
jgi:hypothetical protein